MIRQVKSLKTAYALAGRPACIPKSRPRGAKALGLQYERALAKRLPFAQHGPWFEYWDAAGRGLCQPDFLMETPLGQIVILEVKYTWTPEAILQIERLYKPVVELALGKPCVGVTVCKRLLPAMAGMTITGDIWEAIAVARKGQRPVFQWLGKSPVFSPKMLDLKAA